jgi:hydrogenase nickel incorporation protein HypA/HybF
MHEWALAEAVISTVSQIAEKEDLKEVAEVEIKVGELQQIERDILEFALSQLKTLKLKNVKFHIKTVKAELKCRVCGHKWIFRKEKMNEEIAEAIHFIPEIAHTYIKCPKCGSPDFEILKGRGIWLESVKGLR